MGKISVVLTCYVILDSPHFRFFETPISLEICTAAVTDCP